MIIIRERSFKAAFFTGNDTDFTGNDTGNNAKFILCVTAHAKINFRKTLALFVAS